MKLELELVTKEQKGILAHLLELYQYDFSEYDSMDVNPCGLYGYPYLDYYWTEQNRFAYFIKVDGKLAGFAMVCGHCYVSRDNHTLFMAEFFVMKKYRKLGIGKSAACKVLRRHPGRWELTVHPNNTGAHVFWKKVTAKAAAGPVEVITDVEGVYEDGLATAYLFEV